MFFSLCPIPKCWHLSEICLGPPLSFLCILLLPGQSYRCPLLQLLQIHICISRPNCLCQKPRRHRWLLFLTYPSQSDPIDPASQFNSSSCTSSPSAPPFFQCWLSPVQLPFYQSLASILVPFKTSSSHLHVILVSSTSRYNFPVQS